NFNYNNFSLDGDNPNATDLYTRGKAILSGAPVTNNFDFLFREGTAAQPGDIERGVFEFSTVGLSSANTINSVTLTGYVSLIQNSPAAMNVGFYGYAGDGQVTLADATGGGSTRWGTLLNPSVGTF